MPKQQITTGTGASPMGAYSQGLRAGDFIFVSGQGPVDPSTGKIVGETIEDVPISVLREGDVVLVRPGASVPADGVVLSGKSDVNESMITGESVPVPKIQGAKVIAGTVNGSGSLRVT